MKTFFAVLILGTVALAQTTSADNASIVDAAKKSSTNTTKAKRVFTDDDLPATGDVNVVGEAAAKPAKGSNDPVREQAALDRQWQTRIAQQKALVAKLQAQLDLAQKVLTYDTHRDPIKPNPGYARAKSQVDLLQQQVADAKDKLSQLQDEAHKAGADKAYD